MRTRKILTVVRNWFFVFYFLSSLAPVQNTSFDCTAAQNSILSLIMTTDACRHAALCV